MRKSSISSTIDRFTPFSNSSRADHKRIAARKFQSAARLKTVASASTD
jgi:hypothetical protein